MTSGKQNMQGGHVSQMSRARVKDASPYLSCSLDCLDATSFMLACRKSRERRPNPQTEQLIILYTLRRAEGFRDALQKCKTSQLPS